MSDLALKVAIVNATHQWVNEWRRNLTEYFRGYDGKKIFKASSSDEGVAYRQEVVKNAPVGYDLSQWDRYPVCHVIQDGFHIRLYNESICYWTVEAEKRNERTRCRDIAYNCKFNFGQFVDGLYRHRNVEFTPLITDFTYTSVKDAIDTHQDALKKLFAKLPHELLAIEQEYEEKRRKARSDWEKSPSNIQLRNIIKQIEMVIGLNGKLNDGMYTSQYTKTLWDEPKQHIRDASQPFCDFDKDGVTFIFPDSRDVDA